MAAMTNEGSSIDAAKPSIARVYDYLLGGKDNYAVDREIGDVFKRDLPGSVAIAFANRAALTRAVRRSRRPPAFGSSSIWAVACRPRTTFTRSRNGTLPSPTSSTSTSTLKCWSTAARCWRTTTGPASSR